jgi:hypothetical protein
MSIELEPNAIISGILGGIGAALCLIGLSLFGIRRGCRRLAVRVSDLEERFLSLRGKNAAAARWDQEAWLKGVTASERRPVRQRYDNDPMDLEQDNGVSR